MATRGVLGCGESYIVELGYVARMNGAGDPLDAPIVKTTGILSGITKVEWGRTFNAVAEATITFGGPLGAATCQQLLTGIRPWLHEIRIFRDGERVFEGPIVTNPELTELGAMVLNAKDVIGWFEEGHVHNKYSESYADADPVTIAGDVITENLTGPFAQPPDFPAILPYLYQNPVGDDIDYDVIDERQPVIDILDDLTNWGLLYAAVGRRIVLSTPVDTSNTPKARLTPDHFTSGVELMWDGEDIGTHGWAISSDDPPRIVGYGPVGTIYGCHDTVVDVDEGTSTSSMEKAAERAIKGRRSPPLKISMGSAATLRPTAPIEMRNLRPGSAMVTVQIRGAFDDTFYQAMMITDLTCSWVPNFEEVRVTLEPIGTPSQLPP